MIIPSIDALPVVATTLMILGEDDSSTSSTFAANLTPQKSALATTKDRTSTETESLITRKSVRFNVGANQTFSNTQMCKEECHELWYDMEEYQHFKATAKYLASQISKQDQEQQDTDPFSYQRILLRTHEACRQCPLDLVSCSSSALSLVEEQHLRRWLQGAPLRLGLERYVIRDLGRDRYFRRQDLVRTVVKIQHEYPHDAESSSTARDEHVRQASQAISRPSQLFARHMAQAQAISFIHC